MKTPQNLNGIATKRFEKTPFEVSDPDFGFYASGINHRMIYTLRIKLVNDVVDFRIIFLKTVRCDSVGSHRRAGLVHEVTRRTLESAAKAIEMLRNSRIRNHDRMYYPNGIKYLLHVA